MSRKEDEHQCHRRGETREAISLLSWWNKRLWVFLWFQGKLSVRKPEERALEQRCWIRTATGCLHFGLKWCKRITRLGPLCKILGIQSDWITLWAVSCKSKLQTLTDSELLIHLTEQAELLCFQPCNRSEAQGISLWVKVMSWAFQTLPAKLWSADETLSTLHMFLWLPAYEMRCAAVHFCNICFPSSSFPSSSHYAAKPTLFTAFTFGGLNRAQIWLTFARFLLFISTHSCFIFSCFKVTHVSVF